MLLESSENLLWGSEDKNLWRQPAYLLQSAGECNVTGRGAITSSRTSIQGVGARCIRAVSQLLGPRVSTAKARHFAPRTRDRRCAYDCFSICPNPPSRASTAQRDKSNRENLGPDICSEYGPSRASLPCRPNHSTTTSLILNPSAYIVSSAAWQGLAILFWHLSRCLTHRGSKYIRHELPRTRHRDITALWHCEPGRPAGSRLPQHH